MAVHAPRADASGAAPRSAAPAFVVRPAGRDQALLACDLAARDRPALVTTLLAAFLTTPEGSPVEPVELWNLPVATRHLALVRIVAALDSSDTLTLTVRCPHEDCREAMEVPLALAAFTALHDEHAAQDTLTVPGPGGPVLALRRPTGEDLRRWSAAAPADEAAARDTMLHDLVVVGALPADPAPLAEALEGFDPLLAFTLHTVCPACGRGVEYPLDLEALALARLQERQTRLLHEIHQLARAYGWTESEILAVPAVRRARYLEFLEASLSA